MKAFIDLNTSYLYILLFRSLLEDVEARKTTAQQLRDLVKTYVVGEMKVEAIKSLRNSEHEYASFFVCRNPVDKLLSLYKMAQEKNADRFKKKTVHCPTWEEFITSVVNDDDEPIGCTDFGKHIGNNMRGMTRSLFFNCQPCHFDYNAVIKMETFDDDSK